MCDNHSKAVLNQLGSAELQAIIFALKEFLQEGYRTPEILHLQGVAKQLLEAVTE